MTRVMSSRSQFEVLSLLEQGDLGFQLVDPRHPGPHLLELGAEQGVLLAQPGEVGHAVYHVDHRGDRPAEQPLHRREHRLGAVAEGAPDPLTRGAQVEGHEHE